MNINNHSRNLASALLYAATAAILLIVAWGVFGPVTTTNAAALCQDGTACTNSASALLQGSSSSCSDPDHDCQNFSSSSGSTCTDKDHDCDGTKSSSSSSRTSSRSSSSTNSTPSLTTSSSSSASSTPVQAVVPPGPTTSNPSPSEIAGPPAQDCPIVSDYVVSNKWEIRVTKGDGSHQHDITDLSSDNKSPVLARDCQRVVFTSDRDGRWEIYTMYADGGSVRQLTFSPVDAVGPWWTGDGRIVYVLTQDGSNETHIMNADGSNDQVIAP